MSIKTIKGTGFLLMDEVSSMLLSGDIPGGMDRLILGMQSIRQSFDPDIWQEFTRQTFQEHPLTNLIYQCPFAQHSFTRPRGYAGDAELIDFVYGNMDLSDRVTPLGKDIFEYFMDTPGSRSVRARRDVLAAAIDRVASLTSHPIQVLSVACGHLREAHLSKAVQTKQIDKFFALDRDPLSLSLINEELGDYSIQTVQRSVTALMRKSLDFKNLDLIYSTGLYDYLSQPFAKRLTKVMYEMLRPGGKLIIANFVPDHREVGYMETFLQWHLIYRTKHQLEDVVAEIEPSRIASQQTFLEENGNILFLELVRA
jgi:extracellular factor (EF) 3-hydroxypalmitic acid methyl ester biosynthesis protein